MGEAFEYAKAKVVAGLSAEGLLLTEHAVMTRTAARAGSRPRCSSAPAAPRTRSTSTPTDPAMKALVDERDAHRAADCRAEAEESVDGRGAYDAQMEKLLTDLALKTKAIRDLQAKKDKP